MESIESRVAPNEAERRDELELIAAVLRKDRKATAEFVGRFADPVFAFVRWRLWPAAETIEDVIQDVFVEAWRSLPRYRGDSGLTAWMMGIARHKVQDYYRKRLRSLELPEEPEHPEPAAPLNLEDEILRQEQKSRVVSILSRLPEIYRIVLLWRYWEGHSSAEIAAEIGRTEKAVERLLARARGQFRREFELEQ